MLLFVEIAWRTHFWTCSLFTIVIKSSSFTLALGDDRGGFVNFEIFVVIFFKLYASSTIKTNKPK